MLNATSAGAVCVLLCVCCILAGCAVPRATENPLSFTPSGTPADQSPVTTTPATIPAGTSAAAGPESIVVTATRQVTTATPAPVASPVIPRISEARLNALIRDCKNKLSDLQQSDKADTIVSSYNYGSASCESIVSRELGYLVDASDGNVSFFKGDYGSISGAIVVPVMNRSHAYVFLHTHPKNIIRCTDGSYRTTTRTLNSFSLQDLAFAGELTRAGYHILSLYAIGEGEYLIYPKTEDGWKNRTVINATILSINGDLGTDFSNDVDNIMPVLAKRLDYRYLVDNRVLA